MGTKLLAAACVVLGAVLTVAGAVTMARRQAAWLRLEPMEATRLQLERALALPPGPERERLLGEAAAEMEMYTRLTRKGAPRDYRLMLQMLRQAPAAPAPPP